MSIPYPAKAVANWFIRRSLKESNPVTLMKLLKLVYIAHGWHLAIVDKPLIRDRVEAWMYGPVIPELYHEFKRYGILPIQELATDYEPIFDGKRLIDAKLVTPKIPNDDTRTRNCLKRVWEVYKGFTAIQLSNLTHEAGTPWDSVFNNADANKSEIDDEAIKAYYLRRLNS
ncbi:MAG: DUF4065 domain-containing protein [Candidatus Poribacteria bacterium]|nr:DUF4065 domain-containing protein [Candidatus Poribacteria bacterium]MDE0506818.1 DUF4065 domain-containing protein [Candidatus Poribacteria bacterium]